MRTGGVELHEYLEHTDWHEEFHLDEAGLFFYRVPGEMEVHLFLALLREALDEDELDDESL